MDDSSASIAPRATPEADKHGGRYLSVSSVELDALIHERDEAVEWIGVLRDEMVQAGYPGGDRTVALANVRAMMAEMASLRAELARARSDEAAAQRHANAADSVIGDVLRILGEPGTDLLGRAERVMTELARARERERELMHAAERLLVDTCGTTDEVTLSEEWVQDASPIDVANALLRSRAALARRDGPPGAGEEP